VFTRESFFQEYEKDRIELTEIITVVIMSSPNGEPINSEEEEEILFNNIFKSLIEKTKEDLFFDAEALGMING